MRASRYVAGFDSAGAMLRALARFLHDQDFPALGNPRVLEPLLVAGNLLPARARERLYAASGGLTAVPPRRLGRPFAEDVAAWMASLYPRRRYPMALIGSSNGAAVHLAAALGAPWLPQTFMVPVRNRSNDPDDPRRDLEWGRQPARALLDANPDVQVHHMHDPVQDRLMLEQMTYFRLKRLRLGPAYERFLADTVEPGGTLLVLDCRHTWPVTRVGERHLFQFGAVGGATQQELFQGSDRVAAYLARYRPGRRRWDPPEPDDQAPEAEWGFEPALAADVERFAAQHGYQVRRLSFDAPPDLSPLVADLYRWWYTERGLPDDRLLVESFILLEPWWALAGGLVPLWTTFNTEDAAAPVERYLDQRPPFAEVHLTLFAHGVESVGLAPIERWRAIVDRATQGGRFAGVDPRAYPRDFASFVRYHHAVAGIGQRAPLPNPLPWASVEAFLQRTAGQVRLSPSPPTARPGRPNLAMTEPGLPAGFKRCWTDIGGVRIHDVGTIDRSRPTVVLVPGIGLSHRVMLPIAELLAPHFAVRAPDPPGFGRSDKPRRPLDVPALAEALAAWIQAAGIGRPGLVGNSFGCQVIVELAARHPDRVACAVLQGPTMDPAARSLPRQTWRWLRDTVRERPDPRVRLRDYRDAGPRRVLVTYRLALRDRVEDKLPGVVAPTLVVRGPDDPIVSQAWAETVAGLLPAGQLVITADGAHTLIGQLVEVSLPFLQCHLSPASQDDDPPA